jgi:HTH-type transcriptional regulator / antitoxin HigA
MTKLADKPVKKARFALKPIKNERDRRAALARIDVLMDASKLTRDERLELELLSIVVEHYEHERFPSANVTPQELLESLVTDGGHKQKDIAEGTGIAASTISEIIHGKREINARQAVALGKYFGLRADGFLPE